MVACIEQEQDFGWASCCLLQSMVNFLMDPTGDIPWDEDPTAVDVVHIDTEDVRTVPYLCQV